jgi:hypothetical protein
MPAPRHQDTLSPLDNLLLRSLLNRERGGFFDDLVSIAKDVGSGIGHVVASAGSAVAHSVGDVASGIAHAAADVAHGHVASAFGDLGQAVLNVGKDVGSAAVSIANEEFKMMTKDGGKLLSTAAPVGGLVGSLIGQPELGALMQAGGALLSAAGNAAYGKDNPSLSGVTATTIKPPGSSSQSALNRWLPASQALNPIRRSSVPASPDSGRPLVPTPFDGSTSARLGRALLSTLKEE